jgi:hypothetical protein
MTQSRCETPSVPKNVSTCESEFSIELGSKLVSTSTSVFTADKRDTACIGNPCSHERQMNGCYEVPLENENEENDPEHEGQARDAGAGKGLGDISVLLLYAAPGICGTQDITRFLLARAVGIESASSIGAHGSIDEVPEPTEEAGFYGIASEKDRRVSVLRVDTPNIDAVPQDAVEREDRAFSGGHVAFEPSVEPSTKGSVLSVESHARSVADSHDGTPVKLFATTFEAVSKHEKIRRADSEGDPLRHGGDRVATHDALDTQSRLSHGGRYHGVTDKTEQVQHEEAQDFGKPGKLNNDSLSKPNEERTVDYVDNDGRLLFSHDMSVTAKTCEYAVEGQVDSDEAFEIPYVEKKMQDMSRGVASVSSDRHKRRGDEKARSISPIKGIDKPRLARPAGVSHGVYDGALSKNEVRNPDRTYLQPNQKALRSSMVRQIVDRAELRLGREQAQMIIDLKPDILGKVHLKISQEAGKVVAEIRAENASTKALIESGLSDLKTALSEKGFSFDAVTVSWDSSGGSGGAQSGGNSLPWFSKPGEWVPDGRIAQALTSANTVDSDDVASAIGAFGMMKYLDYIA